MEGLSTTRLYPETNAKSNVKAQMFTRALDRSKRNEL